MLVLHGVFSPDTGKKEDGPRFFVWGEEMPDELVGTRRRGRRPKPDLHPFAAEPRLLADGLARLTAPSGEEETVSQGRPMERTSVREWGADPEDVGYPVRVLSLELPSSGGWPLPSPLLPVAAEEEGREPAIEATLVPWLVPGLVLAPAPAAGLLLILGRPGRSFPAGLLPGADLLYWSKVAGFTQELLVRQRFVPVIDEDLRAGWRIVPGPEEAGRLELLAGAMPPVCRALQTRVRAPAAPALPLVETFIQAAGSGRIRDYLVAAGRERPTSDPPWVLRPGRVAPTGSAHERWLAAVVGGQSEVNAPTEQLKSLAARLEEWARPLVAPAAGLKTCFRLEPPREDRPPDQWRLSFFLQAADDPSLLVSAESVWREKKKTLKVLERRFENPQERLLTDLGVASRLFPPLEAGLNTSRPSWCPLSVEEAYQFLKHAVSLFEESGLGVQVPSFWRARGRAENALGVRLKLSAHQDRRSWSEGVGRGLLGLDTLVDFQWELALGGESLSVEEYRQLSRLKVPLVNVRGHWVELDPSEVEHTLRLLDGRKQGVHTLRDALRVAGGYGDGWKTGLPVQAVQAGGELGNLLEKLKDTGKIALLTPPEGFCGQLRPYQVRGFSWLKFLEDWRLGACLADDMGLGKTIQAIALLLHRVEREKKEGPVLLICPTSVVGNWEREVARFAPDLSVLVHHGPERRAGEEFAAETASHNLVITSYGIVHRDIETIVGVDWAGIILDEAQNIKNPGAARTRAIKRLSAGLRLALTGTPVENRLSELWSIFDFANPGLLGSAGEFREKFALPIERYRDEQKARKLKGIVGPFILRRVKTDPHIIADLPEKQESKVYCSLTREQVTLYGAVVQDMMERIAGAEGIERRGLVLAAMTKLKQVCNHPAQFQKDDNYAPKRSGKLTRLTEMIEELMAAGQAALIFTQFTRMGEILRSHLQSHFGQEILFLHGALAQGARERLVNRFQSGGPPFLILSLRAGGVGLNLTRANHVFHFDRWWNPAVEDQATDRAYRIGQKQNVFVYKFICSGTLEERIDGLMEEKRLLTASVIDAGEDWLTGLSTNELRKLFALGAGVSVED